MPPTWGEKAEQQTSTGWDQRQREAVGVGEAPRSWGCHGHARSCLDSALGIFLLNVETTARLQKENKLMKLLLSPDFLRVKETLKTGQRSNQVPRLHTLIRSKARCLPL